MTNKPTSNAADLDPGEANEILLDITDAQPVDEFTLESDRTPHESANDPADGIGANGEELPEDTEEVAAAAETAEHLRGHASDSVPKDSVPKKER